MNRNFKSTKKAKILSLVLIAALIFTLSSCHSGNINNENDEKDDISASVSDDEGFDETIRLGIDISDSVNPFFADTNANRQLISLSYEPLFRLDSTFQARPDVASSYSESNGTVTVRLDMNTVFSDGVQISANDVIYSYNQAKTSANYSSELSHITTAQVKDSSTVQFSSDRKTQNPVDSLIFPIVKSNTAGNESSVPIGTGLFVFSSDKKFMSVNNYSRHTPEYIKKIDLISLSSDSTLIHTLESGKIDLYFDDLSSGNYSQAGSATSKCNMPNLVFLGLNSSKAGLKNIKVRQAVYYAVNRMSIAKNSFSNSAREAFTPFHPDWHILSDSNFNDDSLQLDLDKSRNLITSAGYSKLNFTLIVYTGNNFKVNAAKEIKNTLSEVGINVTVSELTWADYSAAVSGGNYDMYIGETKLTSDMNLYNILGSGSVIKGSSSDAVLNAYGQYASGKIGISDFMNSFIQNIPFVPLVYRSGMTVYSKDISPSPMSNYMDYFSNAADWRIIRSEEITRDLMSVTL